MESLVPGPSREDRDSLLGDEMLDYIEVETPGQNHGHCMDPMLDSRTTKTIFELTKADDNSNVFGHITVHGWMHKQGQRTFKGPVAKSWRKRYFGK